MIWNHPPRLITDLSLAMVLAAATASPASAGPTLTFIPGEGGNAGEVHWLAQAPGASVTIGSDRLSVGLAGERRRFDLRFLGSQGATSAIGVDPLPGRASFFLGDDASSWRRGLSTFGGVVLHELYPGVDLRLEGDATALKGTYG